MPRLELSAVPHVADVDFCVRLSDVFDDGSAHLLNVGALKGRHVHSHEQPADLEPGRTWMELLPRSAPGQPHFS